jgi:uncharacterized DUF497 family protein
MEVFYDPNAVAAHDDAHSDVDARFLIIGFSSRRLLFVVYAETERKSVRIISARKPTRAERKIYEGRTN